MLPSSRIKIFFAVNPSVSFCRKVGLRDFNLNRLLESFALLRYYTPCNGNMGAFYCIFTVINGEKK